MRYTITITQIGDNAPTIELWENAKKITVFSFEEAEQIGKRLQQAAKPYATICVMNNEHDWRVEGDKRLCRKCGEVETIR